MVGRDIVLAVYIDETDVTNIKYSYFGEVVLLKHKFELLICM
jgi:hypothetical protein